MSTIIHQEKIKRNDEQWSWTIGITESSWKWKNIKEAITDLHTQALKETS
jgi:hypothetical protein